MTAQGEGSTPGSQPTAAKYWRWCGLRGTSCARFPLPPPPHRHPPPAFTAPAPAGLRSTLCVCACACATGASPRAPGRRRRAPAEGGTSAPAAGPPGRRPDTGARRPPWTGEGPTTPRATGAAPGAAARGPAAGVQVSRPACLQLVARCSGVSDSCLIQCKGGNEGRPVDRCCHGDGCGYWPIQQASEASVKDSSGT